MDVRQMSALNHTLATRGSQDAVRRNRRIQRALTKLYAITKGWLLHPRPANIIVEPRPRTRTSNYGVRSRRTRLLEDQLGRADAGSWQIADR
eukprot:scaffold43722_cov101-Phaeocystis_antarctica.AAC.1